MTHWHMTYDTYLIGAAASAGYDRPGLGESQVPRHSDGLCARGETHQGANQVYVIVLNPPSVYDMYLLNPHSI
jgi:hypothetical protein